MKMKSVLPKRLPEPQAMDSAEREYLRNLMLYQRAYVALVSSGLNEMIHGLQTTAGDELPKEMRHDSHDTKISHKFVSHMDVNIEKSIRNLFDQVQRSLMDLFPDKTLRRWAQMMTAHVNDTSKKNITKMGKSVDVDIEPLLSDGKLNPFFKNVVDENVGLIRSIPEERMASFKNALVGAITADKPHSEIAKIISKSFKATQSKMTFIARDQVNKLNGKLNQYRQQTLGGSRYVWRASRDRRTRTGHAMLDGKICDWNSAPVVDKASGRRAHPGQDFQCRCTAEMILSDVLDTLD